MTHEEQRIYLIKSLLAEDSQYVNTDIPTDEKKQKDLLRALMNVRPPEPINEEFLAIQDAYLQEERDQSALVDVADIPVLAIDSRLAIWQGDITMLKIDAIVNAANNQMLGCFQPLHSCIDNIIHSKSGIQLRLTCNDIMQAQGHAEPTGQAKITSGYNLPCRYILHTVGPIVGRAVTEQDRIHLASSYRSCLELAAENGVKSVAFCCISTGVFHFPNDEAAEIAVAAVRDFLAKDNRIEKVVFNVFKDLDLEIYHEILGEDNE